MKLLAIRVLAPLLFTSSALGQVAPMCNQVRSASAFLAAAKVSPDPDLRAAVTACEGPGDEASRQRALAPLHLSPQRLFAWLDPAASKLAGHDLFDWLPVLAKAAFRAEALEKAQSCARELLQLAQDNSRDRDYGDAIYDGYVVMGRVALRHGNVTLARQYLLNAATTPGSAGLEKNGPNMVLAKELLDQGQTSAVLQFFVLCREFWKADNGRLAAWTAAVRQHQAPDFGSNLEY